MNGNQLKCEHHGLQFKNVHLAPPDSNGDIHCKNYTLIRGIVDTKQTYYCNDHMLLKADDREVSLWWGVTNTSLRISSFERNKCDTNDECYNISVCFVYDYSPFVSIPQINLLKEEMVELI